MSDEKPKQKCPNCASEVSPGQLECQYCGTNVKTGETFEMKVKRAEVKGVHAEKYVRHIFAGVAVAFALAILGGFLTQKGTEEFVKKHPMKFRNYAIQMRELDRLIDAGQTVEAAAKGKSLREEIQKHADGLDEGPTLRRGKKYRHDPISKAKLMLLSLVRTVDNKLEMIERQPTR